MKIDIIRFKKLGTWDITSLTVYFLVSMSILFVGLNDYEYAERFISIYAFSTPLFLYLINYKSLRNFIVDRKSTRLNSSHVAISYAVFCLKKKTDIRYLMFT